MRGAREREEASKTCSKHRHSAGTRLRGSRTERVTGGRRGEGEEEGQRSEMTEVPDLKKEEKEREDGRESRGAWHSANAHRRTRPTPHGEGAVDNGDSNNTNKENNAHPYTQRETHADTHRH